MLFRSWVLFLNADASVRAHRKISATEGGFTGELDDVDFFAYALAAPGDLDGDGRGELVATSLRDDDGGENRGAAWVLFLAPDGSVAAQQKISDKQGGFEGTLDAGEEFGSALTTLGDLDGNGVLDLAVGAPADDDTALHPNFAGDGAVWVLLLDEQGGVLRRQRINEAEGGLTGELDVDDRFGGALAALGDLDGDGVGELAVGATGRRHPFSTQHGKVYVLFLASDGTVKAQQKIGEGLGGFAGSLPLGEEFGAALASLGDLDGDGLDELAVGAPGANRVYVLFLAADGSVRSQVELGPGLGGFGGVLTLSDRFGSALARLDDLDGDGLGELAVGALGRQNGFPLGTRGALWVLFLGRDGRVRAERELAPELNGFTGALRMGDLFGCALAAPGDLDGDGVGDLCVGARGDDDGRPNLSTGAVWTLFLARDGSVRGQQKISATRGSLPEELGRFDEFGWALAALGDIDGDGLGDLCVGSPSAGRGGRVWRLRLDGVATADFERGDDAARTPLVNGQSLVAGPFGRTLALAGSGANLGPALFDSTPAGPNDPSQDRDLLVGRGHVLVLQNSLAPRQTVPGVFDRPNDDQDGGTLALDFVRGPVRPRSLDLVDIDRGAALTTNVVLFDQAGRRRVYSVPPGWTEDVLTDGPPGWRTLDLTAKAPQPGFAASATMAENPSFLIDEVVRIEVELGGSGAIDRLRWDPRPE